MQWQVFAHGVSLLVCLALRIAPLASLRAECVDVSAAPTSSQATVMSDLGASGGGGHTG